VLGLFDNDVTTRRNDETTSNAKSEIRNAKCTNAVIAQLVEHVHGKDGVPGSIPGDGSIFKCECESQVSGSVSL
jgi:hypothetical protein